MSVSLQFHFNRLFADFGVVDKSFPRCDKNLVYTANTVILCLYA